MVSPSVATVFQAERGHAFVEKRVLFAPDNLGGDVDVGIRYGRASELASCGAIPVDHARGRARLLPGVLIARQIGFRKSAGPTTGQQVALAQMTENPFGRERELKEEHVPTFQLLVAMFAQEAAKHRGMRNVENGEFFHPRRMMQRQPPGHGRAPVVSGHACFVHARSVDETDDVLGQVVDAICSYVARLFAEIVTSLIGNPDAETGFRERGDLSSPTILKLWKTVQQDDQWPLGIAILNHV